MSETGWLIVGAGLLFLWFRASSASSAPDDGRKGSGSAIGDSLLAGDLQGAAAAALAAGAKYAPAVAKTWTGIFDQSSPPIGQALDRLYKTGRQQRPAINPNDLAAMARADAGNQPFQSAGSYGVNRLTPTGSGPGKG